MNFAKCILGTRVAAPLRGTGVRVAGTVVSRSDDQGRVHVYLDPVSRAEDFFPTDLEPLSPHYIPPPPQTGTLDPRILEALRLGSAYPHKELLGILLVENLFNVGDDSDRLATDLNNGEPTVTNRILTRIASHYQVAQMCVQIADLKGALENTNTPPKSTLDPRILQAVHLHGDYRHTRPLCEALVQLSLTHPVQDQDRENLTQRLLQGDPALTERVIEQIKAHPTCVPLCVQISKLTAANTELTQSNKALGELLET